MFREGRVILDRPECSQPISQHQCDIDLSARRRQGGGEGPVGRRGWGQREAGCGVMAFKSLMKALVVSKGGLAADLGDLSGVITLVFAILQNIVVLL